MKLSKFIFKTLTHDSKFMFYKKINIDGVVSNSGSLRFDANKFFIKSESLVNSTEGIKFGLPYFHSRKYSNSAKQDFLHYKSFSRMQKYIINSNIVKTIDNPNTKNHNSSQYHREEKSTTHKIKGSPMSSIVHTDDAISTRLFAQWITSRYSFSIDKFIPIQEPTIDKITSDKKFKDVLELDGQYKNYIAINDEAMIVISKKKIKNDQERSESFFEVFAKDIKTYYMYYEYVMALDKASQLDTLIVEYCSFSISSYGSVTSNTEYFKKDIFNETIDAFYKPYLDTDLLFEQFLKSRSVMLQLTGKPGLGKSKLIALFIKYLIDNSEYAKENNKIKIARPASSEVLAEEEFWVKLRQGGFQALVLDDVDHILQKRNESVSSSEEKMHNEIIRKILTFTDGLTSQKSKILISTNLEYHKIDKALIRDFRLFDSIELRELTKREARKIWVETYKLEKNTFHEIFSSVGTITAAKLSSEIDNLKRVNGGNHNDGVKSYLKEDGISKIKSLRNRSSRIGLI